MCWIRFLVGIIAVFALPVATADPLVVSAKVRPESPSVGDVVGVYITILGQQNESVQVFTKLKSPMFKVVDVLTKESIPYNTIKPDTIDFDILKGQTVEITIIGDMPDTETLAVLFPNAYRIDSPSIKKESTPTPQKVMKNESATQSEQLLKRSQLLRRYGALYAGYEDVRNRIPERLQLIIEEKLRIAKTMIENDKLEEAAIILDEIEGLLEPFSPKPDNSSAILAILAVIAVGAVFVWWRYYHPNRREPEEADEFQTGSLRLLR